MARSKKKVKALVHDILMILLGVAAAIIYVESGLLDVTLNALDGNYAIASFIAGIFFTSAFTLAPSSVAFVHLAQSAPVGPIALWGGLGAMVGDLILFLFIRDHFADDLLSVLKPSTVKMFFKSLHFGFMKWLSPIIGALIIASPLPDEFGVTLLGMSKVKVVVLLPVTFLMNILGIYLLLEFSKFF